MSQKQPFINAALPFLPRQLSCLPLHCPACSLNSFSRGGTETFAVMADDVGPITNITLRIDAANDISDAWGLQEINVVCESSW